MEHSGETINVYLGGTDRADIGFGRIENDMLCEQWPEFTTAFEICVVIFRFPGGNAPIGGRGDYLMVTDTGPHPFEVVE